MGGIVDLNDYRIQRAVSKGFGPWRTRFGKDYGAATRLADLCDHTIQSLAQPGDQSTEAFYELIMGCLDLGNLHKFGELDNATRMQVVEIHLFLADQVRFEMMRRLGWVRPFDCGRHPLVAIILKHAELRTCGSHPPELHEGHPQHAAYAALDRRDREAFIRRLLRAALESFARAISPAPG